MIKETKAFAHRGDNLLSYDSVSQSLFLSLSFCLSVSVLSTTTTMRILAVGISTIGGTSPCLLCEQEDDIRGLRVSDVVAGFYQRVVISSLMSRQNNCQSTLLVRPSVLSPFRSLNTFLLSFPFLPSFLLCLPASLWMVC